MLLGLCLWSFASPRSQLFAFQSNAEGRATSALSLGLVCQEVERALLETAQQNPNDFAAQQRLGEFYLQQNRLPEGIPYLEKAQRSIRRTTTPATICPWRI